MSLFKAVVISVGPSLVLFALGVTGIKFPLSYPRCAVPMKYRCIRTFKYETFKNLSDTWFPWVKNFIERHTAVRFLYSMDAYEPDPTFIDDEQNARSPICKGKKYTKNTSSGRKVCSCCSKLDMFRAVMYYLGIESPLQRPDKHRHYETKYFDGRDGACEFGKSGKVQEFPFNYHSTLYVYEDDYCCGYACYLKPNDTNFRYTQDATLDDYMADIFRIRMRYSFYKCETWIK